MFKYESRSFSMARQNGALTVLNVAEKNDAAKEISRVLSSGRSQRVGSIAVVYLVKSR